MMTVFSASVFRKASVIPWMLILVLLLVAVSCKKGDGFDKDDLEIKDVCLKVSGEIVYQHKDDGCQIAWNSGRKQFRAGTDTMSDYFVLDLEGIPSKGEQTVVGSVKWTTSDNVVSYSDLSFTVQKVSDDMVWLWNEVYRITAVIRLVH